MKKKELRGAIWFFIITNPVCIYHLIEACICLAWITCENPCDINVYLECDRHLGEFNKRVRKKLGDSWTDLDRKFFMNKMSA